MGCHRSQRSETTVIHPPIRPVHFQATIQTHAVYAVADMQWCKRIDKTAIALYLYLCPLAIVCGLALYDFCPQPHWKRDLDMTSRTVITGHLFVSSLSFSHVSLPQREGLRFRLPVTRSSAKKKKRKKIEIDPTWQHLCCDFICKYGLFEQKTTCEITQRVEQ